MTTEEHVRDAYPEIELIESESLREKVVDAWTLVLDESEYERLDEVPGMPLNAGAWAIDIDNVTHTRGVTRLSREVAESCNQHEGSDLNLDHITAGALCHDMGKYFEFTELDSGRFVNSVWSTSQPAIRHPIYSAAVAWSLDFPVEVVHIIANHANEGDHVVRSQAAHIVDLVDTLWWRVMVPEATGRPYEEVHAADSLPR